LSTPLNTATPTGESHGERGGEAEDDDGRALEDEQPRPTDGTRQHVPQRAQVGLPRDRVARDDRHREREEERQRDREADEGGEDAVVGDLVEEARPRSRARSAP
jgi:hypothetical protein